MLEKCARLYLPYGTKRLQTRILQMYSLFLLASQAQAIGQNQSHQIAHIIVCTSTSNDQNQRHQIARSMSTLLSPRSLFSSAICNTSLYWSGAGYSTRNTPNRYLLGQEQILICCTEHALLCLPAALTSDWTVKLKTIPFATFNIRFHHRT